MSDKKPDTNPELLDLPRPVQWVIGAVVGIGAGLTGAATQIRGEFHKKLLNYTDAKKMDADHGTNLESLTRQKIESGSSMTAKEYIKKTRTLKNDFARELDNFAENRLGIASHGPQGLIKGTFQRFGTLGENTRLPIIFGAITTTVIGGACTMMFFNSMHTRERLEMINDKVTGEKSR